jgi:glycosyltransferase involved in cell wall biosynthesis
MLQTLDSTDDMTAGGDSFPLLHFTESLERLGGVESVIKLVLDHDPGSAVVPLLDTHGATDPRIFRFRKHRFSGSANIRKAAQKSKLTADTLIFHNFAGLMMLGDTIPHRRKVLFLHTNSPDVFFLLPSRIPCVDGVLTSGDDLKQEILYRFPGINIPVLALEYPLDPRCFSIEQQRLREKVVIGFSGRIETVQKNVFRLCGLCTELEHCGISFRLEIAGGGTAEQSLQKKLAKWNVRFLGRLEPDQLYANYRQWDFMVCTSDYETGPIVMLEAMASGVLPIMPDIPCQATRLLHACDYPLYLAGDMASAAKLIVILRNKAKFDLWRNTLAKQVEDRHPQHFITHLAAAIDVIGKIGKVGISPPPNASMLDFLPFALRARLPGGTSFLR